MIITIVKSRKRKPVDSLIEGGIYRNESGSFVFYMLKLNNGSNLNALVLNNTIGSVPEGSLTNCDIESSMDFYVFEDKVELENQKM